MYDALTKGFSLEKGKYFAWINSDDLYFNNAIEMAISIMEKNKFEITEKTTYKSFLVF